MVMHPDNAYEAERAARIIQNEQRMRDLGVLKQKSLFDSAFTAVKNPLRKRTARKGKKVRRQPERTSRRLSGTGAELAGLTDQQADAADCGCRRNSVGGEAAAEQDEDSKARWTAALKRRCDSSARGSLYDSVAGVTCHFCRQKKLCGEADCQRCSTRDADQDCIGKSECSRCGDACGRFCRACLLVRYGQSLDDVRRQMAAGAWLCPHCYEEEHPQQGWICNSSICMKRRGMAPTGIAIFEAQAQGFASVAHLVQHRLLQRRAAAGADNNAAGC